MMRDSSITFSGLSPSDYQDLLCFRELLKADGDYGEIIWAHEHLFGALTSIFVGLGRTWDRLEKNYQATREDTTIINSYPEDDLSKIDCIEKIVTCDYPELIRLIKQINDLSSTGISKQDE